MTYVFSAEGLRRTLGTPCVVPDTIERADQDPTFGSIEFT